MRLTLSLAAKGFWGRSFDEFKRWTTMVLNSEGMRVPTKPYILASFENPTFINDCKIMSDQDIGGFSTSSLEWIPPCKSSNPTLADNLHGHARFHGNISIQLPLNRPEIQRTGFAAWRTKDRGYTIFGKSLWDIDPYTFLALRIKSDGRKYFVNLQTESIVQTDIHQHRLYAKRPGEWETVLIPWSEFVRTNHGVVVEPQREMLRQSLRTIGIGLTDRVPGKFMLCIEKIWATNNLDAECLGQVSQKDNLHLKTKNGNNITWVEVDDNKKSI
ncbi:Complex I intermediate-associated protein 30, mitochondrial [Erysiphe necator]|uniref:Putative complex i intermediate-associated protein 30 n=1 Tax=Uncinula necator TaxID=52586 RepID=A0A0B1PD55_UNCNE|nr:Complex I intermediate-associated protein 30, mitochondrial [Erysiphe necator]KHJ34599.1 putative complex i intermediate-associated protein 30 [Erysiphe necator]